MSAKAGIEGKGTKDEFQTRLLEGESSLVLLLLQAEGNSGRVQRNRRMFKEEREKENGNS